jgi:AraC family transcriptional activator of pobA
MKAIFSKSGEYFLGLKTSEEEPLTQPVQSSEYALLFIPNGTGIYHADGGAFHFTGPVLLFATPFQAIEIERKRPLQFSILQFHADFYCIEYHKAEVSCNGLLFNNIYIQPCVTLSAENATEFEQLLQLLGKELDQDNPSEIVVRAWLQLLLAKSSSIKLKSLSGPDNQVEKDELMEQFRELLDQYYLKWHKPNDYARILGISPNNFTKRSKRYFSKSPSQLIQERLILEAKKQLHLTRRSVKEIAYSLKFQDEFYFSRFFKKITKVSPQTFRKRTGISIMADLSM